MSWDSCLYKRHNSRRQEHLASLNLPIPGKSVIELGAGQGDHSSFFIDRSCPILITEARKENINLIKKQLETLRRIAYSVAVSYGHEQKSVDIQQLDMDKPTALNKRFDIGYHYGLLYHQEQPAKSLEWSAKHCDMLLLETCLSFGDDAKPNMIQEKKQNPTQSFNGDGCRPTRLWVVQELNKHYKYVYIPKTQPNHPAFPIDWTDVGRKAHKVAFVRGVFIASNTPLENQLLVECKEARDLPMQQTRH